MITPMRMKCAMCDGKGENTYLGHTNPCASCYGVGSINNERAHWKSRAEADEALLDEIYNKLIELPWSPASQKAQDAIFYRYAELKRQIAEAVK